MKISIYRDPTQKPITIRKSVRDVYALDGYAAKIVQLDDVQIHSVKDIDALIDLLINAKPCFESGGKGTGYFEP